MNEHISTTTLQAFLDDRLSREERLVAEGHLASCAHCRAELARWTELFGALATLPALAPSPALRERVLAGTAGVRPLVPTPAPEVAQGWHPTPEELLDSVDGVASAGAAARVTSHLAACTACTADVERWQGLFSAMSALPLHAPSDGFRERVLARVPAARPQTLPGRAQLLVARTRAAVGRVRPRGWAALAGVATAPAAAAVMIVWSLFSNPMVTVSGLASYGWWKAVELVQALWAPLGTLLASIDTTAIDGLLTPGGLALGFVVLGAMSFLSLWTLYRNLIPHRTSGGTYARART